MPDSPTLLDLFAEDIGHASQLLQLVDEEFQALNGASCRSCNSFSGPSSH